MWGGTVLGDFLVLTGAALYAISNILQELYMCEGADPSEYLMVLGIFGSIILTIQSYALEYDNILALNNSNQYLCIVGFSICLAIDYAIAPYFFKNFGATFYNLSLLMSPLYSLFFDIFYSQGTYDALYLIGFCFVMIGILIYNIPVQPPKEDCLNSELSTLEEKEKILKE
jgi:drug/metabolite transporter (DMT)-like permease